MLARESARLRYCETEKLGDARREERRSSRAESMPPPLLLLLADKEEVVLRRLLEVRMLLLAVRLGEGLVGDRDAQIGRAHV